MKKVKFLTISIFAIALFASCSDDDVPETVLPQEVITTLRLTLEPDWRRNRYCFRIP